MFNYSFLLEASSGGGWEQWSGIIMIAVFFVIIWFFMIRPQKKQEKKDAEMRNALSVGDEVTTIGGIIGKVISIKDETFVLETTKDKTKIRFLKGAIRTVDVKAEEIANAVIERETKANEEANGASDDVKTNDTAEENSEA